MTQTMQVPAAYIKYSHHHQNPHIFIVPSSPTRITTSPTYSNSVNCVVLTTIPSFIGLSGIPISSSDPHDLTTFSGSGLKCLRPFDCAESTPPDEGPEDCADRLERAELVSFEIFVRSRGPMTGRQALRIPIQGSMVDQIPGLTFVPEWLLISFGSWRL